MKKILLTLALSATLHATRADEGMWTLYNLPKAVYETMKAEGFALPYEKIYESNDAIMRAVVNFSGYCSGVVVSPDGLVFTNHHCGFEAIRSHSTVEHDYMLNGFVAKSHAEELPNENMFVSFMTAQEDITDRVMALGYEKLGHEARTHLIDSLQTVLTSQARTKDSTLRVQIDPFYEGNKFYATTCRDFTDLRLVFTIPKSMGKFGGETDNWMWPRQTCDFSVFRIYADPKTNGPAPYSPSNVPYHPATWAPVSMQGYAEGDYAMTMGYPGSTSRYLSSYGIQEMRDAQNAPRSQVRGVKQDIMIRHMRASEAVRIKYDSKFAQSSNYWKNAIGMNKCIDSIGIISQKRNYEKQIQAYQDSTGFLRGKLSLKRMAGLYEKRMKTMKLYTLWRETFSRTSEFNTRAMQISNGMPVKGPKDKPAKQYLQFEDNSKEWDETLDKEVMAALMRNFREQAGEENLPAFYTTIDKKFNGSYTDYVNWLYKKSALMKKGARLYFNSKAYAKDPGVVYGMDLLESFGAIRDALKPLYDSIDVQEKHLCAAKLRMEEDKPHYSDANFTMRLSYGQVGGFELGGKPSGYYTTAPSIVSKMKRADSNIEYFAEPVMHQLLSASDFGPYTDPKSKSLQLCFLTNNDITGGNSGSPMFDGQGRLIGLAFDGNWDSLSSDINFDARLARCIGVDIRYVLYMMDRWGHADHLIREISPR